MALYHRATLTPTKHEVVVGWIPTQSWGPSADAAIEVVGAFRFDDPNGRVGMEAHIVTDGETWFFVPLTYRDEPLPGADDALITEMDHSALGTRWVYDGLGDQLYVTMLAAVTMTGQGEALGMVDDDDRWVIAPANVRIAAGGWTGGHVAVDQFDAIDLGADPVVFTNDRFELTVHRRPAVGERSSMGLTAVWEGSAPVVLASVSALA